LVIEPTEYFDRLELDVMLGSLDPAEELTGVQMRLSNLGFDCSVDGQASEALARAVSAFQSQFGLPVTGDADPATRAKLGEVHDKTTKFPEDPLSR
jgi:peptidoglycan hydrolase-like protein with peptidoglycan-binding domain